jgi:hypothetical protein
MEESQYRGVMRINIDLKDIGLPRELLLLVRRIYNDPQTNKYTKDVIRFELQRLLGRNYDIKKFLQEKE